MKAPRRVDNVEEYWGDKPPRPSHRCVYWLLRFKAGWAPNRRIRSFGYYASAEWYGVWIWEYLNVLAPIIARNLDNRPSV